MKRSHIPWSLVVGAALALASGRAIPEAAAQSDAEIALAKQWFKDGEAAEKKKDWAKALDLFQKALTVKQTPQIYLRVGALEERLGKLVEALLSYERAEEKATGAHLDDLVTVAKDSADAIRPRVPTLVLAPAQPYAGLSATLDGAALASATLSDKLPIDPGDHKLTLSATGHEPFEATFSVAENEVKRLGFELKATPIAIQSPDAASTKTNIADAPAHSSSKLPYVLVGGGAVGVAVGVVLFVVSAHKDSSINALCGGSARAECPQSMQAEITSDVSSVNAFRATSFVVGGLGLVSAGVGAYMLVSKPKDQAKADASPSTYLTPIVGAGSVGLSARGSF